MCVKLGLLGIFYNCKILEMWSKFVAFVNH